MTKATFAQPFSDSESSDYAPVLKWIMINTLAVVGVIALWHFGYVEEMLETERTRISLVIVGIFVVTALHCLYQTVMVSRELVATRKIREMFASSGRHELQLLNSRNVALNDVPLESGILNTHIANLITKAGTQGRKSFDQTLLLRSLADQLKAREKLGWFVSESLLRLALLGTAVGFILMLIPISGLDAFDPESLRGTLAGMTEGMAIALNVTVIGIGTALLLKFEYYLLDEAIADLFRDVTELTEVYVVPQLQTTAPETAGTNLSQTPDRVG